MTPTLPDYLCALDLGSAQDYSALVVLERRWEAGGVRPLPHFLVRHIKRWPLLTSYPDVVRDTVDLVGRSPLRRPPLAVDQTGVGKPVVDMLREARPDARIIPVTITAGSVVTSAGAGYNVPKRDLVSVLQVTLQSRRLRLAALPERQLLARELAAFRIKVSATGHDSYSAWRDRDHDDLVLAVALGCWVGSRQAHGAPAAGGEPLASPLVGVRPVPASGPYAAGGHNGFPPPGPAPWQ